MKTLHTIYTNFAKRVFFVLFTLIIGGGSALGATWTWTASNVNELGSNTSNAITLNGKEWTTTRSSGTNQNQLLSDCIQIGANGAAQTITLKSSAFTGKILSVAVECASYQSYHSVAISVGGTSYLSATPTPKWTTVGSKEGTGESSGEIQISFTKNNSSARALYLKSITIEYDESSVEDDEPVSSCGWVATDINNLSSTDLVVITMTNSTGTTYAMSNNNGTGSAPAAVEVEVDGTSLTSEITENIKWNVGGSNNAYTFYPNGDASKWLYATSTNNGVRVGTNANKTFKIDATSGYLFHNGTSRYIGVYNSQDWRCYTTVHANIQKQTLKFYKYVPCGSTETTISFDANGGAGAPSSVTATKNKPMPSVASSLPSRTGYTFKGFYDAQSGGTKYYNADGTSAKDWDKDDAEYTLYAQWTANQHSLTWDLNGGTVTTAGTNAAVNATGTASGSVAYGTAINAPVVIKTGYTFAGWHDGNAIVTPPNTMPDNNISYKAQWTANTYSVQFNANEGTGEMKNQSFTYDAVPTALSANIFERVGYNFNSWNTAQDGTGTRYNDEAEVQNLTAAANGVVTLYAQWTAKKLINYRTLCEYEITWLIDENPYIDGTPTTTVQAGKTITTLPTNPTDNALGCCSDKFMGWTTSTAKTIENQYLYETIEEIQAKFPSIYEDLTFRAVFATTAQGVGTSVADFSQMGYDNGTPVTDQIILGDGEGHGDATITLAKAQSSSDFPTYYDDGEAVRVYAGGTITIESTFGNATIKKVVFTFGSNDPFNSIICNTGSYDAGISTWTGDGKSVTFTISGSTGHRRIASIEVTTGVTGSQYTNYVTHCTSLDEPALEDGSVPAIDVDCGKFSALDNSPSITFSVMQDLTCPVTFEVTEGNFLISTAKDRAAQYQSKIKVTPYKTGENTGKLKNVYVRANATDHNESFTGKIEVSSDELNEDIVIVLNAIVNCQGYTLTLKDHLGNTIGTPTPHYEGEIIELPTELEEEDACSENYTFDGWSTSEVEYGSLIYNKVSFLYTMPAKDVILYPVYRINDTEDYHRVTSDLGANNWAGDYLIAAEKDGVYHFANGAVEHIGIAESKQELTVNDNIVSATEGEQYFVKLIAVDYGYVLQSRSGKYNYIRNNESSGLDGAVSLSTAIDYPLTVTFNQMTGTISIANTMTSNDAALQYTKDSKCFRFYKPGNQTPIYLYRKSPLYTSSLICEEITAENAMVTSTADQTVKVNVTATMSNMIVNRPRTLTVESDNTDFTATITETATNTYNVAVSYTPSAEDNTDGKETATITINVNDIPVTTFQVTGRHLPENFVIAAKWGDNWYALPANCVNSGDSKQGVLIDVNDINNPTSATAPTTTKYGLRGVKPGRQADCGQSVLFSERVSGIQKALYQNNGANENIWVYDQYDNYDAYNPTYYEWIPSTNDLTNYTFTHSASSRKLGVNENGVFGAYTTDVQVRLLPATFYDQVAVQVIKWKENSVIVMYTGAATTATTQVGTHDATAQTLANQKITHGIYELTTTQSLTANAGKILTMCFGTAQVKVEIPLIVNGNTTASKNGHDVVILDRGKLTASTTLYSYKNVYVYGGGKLAIPTGTQLGVKNIILRAGGVATDGNGQNPTYQHIYPQVELKGTLSTPTDASGFMKYEYVTDYDHWYHLVLPFDARYNTITYPQEYYGDNVTSNNTGSWQIKRYAGEIRATGNYDAWVDIETEDARTVTAGKGYIYWAAPKKVTVNGSKERQKWGIQRITLGKTPSVATTEENKEKNISGLSSYATIQGNSGKDNDQGWNLIGNPYMMNLSNMDETGLQVGKLVEEKVNGKWTGRWEWLNDGFRYLTIPSDHFDTYTAKTISAATPLVAGRAFFVQLAGDANAVTFKAENRPNLMPALRATTQIEKDIETGIVLSNETLQDEMNFWIKDGKTNDYEYNADYPKTPNNNRFNIYGVHTNGDLSWVAISPELAAESMPIGYQVPAAGTYMLSLSETYYSDDLQALYVTDHAMSPEITVDLMTNNYYFDVNQAETNDTRFTVSLQVKSSGNGGVTTDNENIDVDKNQPIKFIYQDKLYILRNGVIYDGTGKQVQTINK